MNEAMQALVEAWRAGLKPDPRLSVVEWAEANIVLPAIDSAEPGPIRFDRTPFLREIANNLSSSSPIWKTSLKKGVQIGGTTTGSCFLGYVIDHSPGPMLYATATLDLARFTSKARLARLISSSDALVGKVADKRSSEGSNEQLLKMFPGGMLRLVGANSAASLRSMPARFGFADEVDRWPIELEGEGEPLELFFARFHTFGRKKKLFIVSTPLEEGTSRIEDQFLKGDQREYRVPCIRCGVMQPIEFAYLRGRDGARFDSSSPPSEVFLECRQPECRTLIPERAKTDILEAGEWTPTVKNPIETGHRSYRLPSWYSPLGWYSWTEGVKLFLEAKHKNDVEKLKVWTNTIDADTWKEQETKIDERILWNRREKYAAEVPKRGLFLTAGVDIQDDRIEVTVWAWGVGFECWAVENRVFWKREGVGPEEYPSALWDRLDDFLLGSWQHESGTPLYCAAVGIDTGGHATQQAYQFVKDREARDIYAMKGKGGSGIPEVLAPSKRRSGENDIPVELFQVGTDAMKDKLFSRLALRSPTTGYIHFPKTDDFDEEFFASLTGEKKIIRYRKGFRVADWVKFRRNDVLDCYVYGYAAALILSPDWEALRAELGGETPERTDEPAPRHRQVRRRNWVTDW